MRPYVKHTAQCHITGIIAQAAHNRSSMHESSCLSGLHFVACLLLVVDRYQTADKQAVSCRFERRSVSNKQCEWVSAAESDKARCQRHHDELVMQINECKSELHDKKKERGAVSDSNRKSGYDVFVIPCIAVPVLRHSWLPHLQQLGGHGLQDPCAVRSTRCSMSFTFFLSGAYISEDQQSCKFTKRIPACKSPAT